MVRKWCVSVERNLHLLMISWDERKKLFFVVDKKSTKKASGENFYEKLLRLEQKKSGQKIETISDI